MDSKTSHAAAGVTLALDAAAVELVEALGERHVRSLVLKGPALAHWLYDVPGERSYDDVDLLVSPGQLAGAESVLRRLGFRFVHGDTHGRIWVRGPVNIDLHGRLAGVRADPERAFEILAGAAEPLVLRRGTVAVLAPHARALHLALHAAQHGALEGKAIEDLGRGIERLPEPLWHAAALLAAELDAEPALAAGLLLVPAGDALVNSLALPRDAARLAATPVGDAPPLTDGLVRLAATPGLWAKAALVAREAAPTSAYLRAHVPLARRGRVGLALARAWRPVWLLLRLGPALLAVRRASRRRRP